MELSTLLRKKVIWMKLAGRVAIVTGGGAGIGRGIVQCLTAEGADVAIIDVDQANAERAAEEARQSGRRSLALVADVADSREAVKAIQSVINTLGKIDILVNNVGGEARFYHQKPGQPYSEEQEWDDNVRLNLRTTMVMSKAVAPIFVEQKSGKIVNIASIGGRPPRKTGLGGGGMSGTGASFSSLMSYGVAKAGVLQFTMSLALQLAEFNVNVNCICPGVLYTPLYEQSAPRRINATPGAEGMTAREFFDKYVVARVPLGREQTPQDIGHAVVFFASEDARNITGQSLNVDGGMVPG
jgi:NAD(P)-dependent dehydrogenase (short-subunit alcohol dehydrogenase family)